MVIVTQKSVVSRAMKLVPAYLPELLDLGSRWSFEELPQSSCPLRNLPSLDQSLAVRSACDSKTLIEKNKLESGLKLVKMDLRYSRPAREKNKFLLPMILRVITKPRIPSLRGQGHFIWQRALPLENL